MKRLVNVLVLVCLTNLSALADVDLNSLNSFGSAGWNTSVSGNTATFRNWGGAGWWLDGYNASSFSKVTLTFESAAQGGNLQVYYSDSASEPGEKIEFAAGATSVSADLNASRRSAIAQVIVSCASGSLTLTSAKFVGSGTNTGDNPGSGTTITTGDHGFVVSGTRLLDAKNNEFVMRGTNLAYAWYKGFGYSAPIEAMRRAGANCVRVVLADGDKWTRDNSSTISSIIAKCEQQQMVAILEVHDATGVDNVSALNNAARFWADNASVLKGHEHTVIINIANEWYGSWTNDGWSDGYKGAVKTIRNAGLKHCLMIDAAGWGQYPGCIRSRGAEVLDSDPDSNIIFSIHMYGSAGKAGSVDYNITSVLNLNLCLCIGEFGWYHSDGDVDEDTILSTCQSKNVGWMSWSWWGNGGELGYLDMVNDINNENSYAQRSAGGKTCNWGQKIMSAWRSQAKTCTVYTNEPASKPDTPEEQGLMDIQSQPAVKKILRDGRLIIVRDNKEYTLTGYRL